MTPIYIFDLDGTLANNEHRVHHVQGEKKDWDAYYSKCLDDTPIKGLVQIARALAERGATIWIWSSRSESRRAETEMWLGIHLGLDAAAPLRTDGDRRPDYKVKMDWLNALTPEEKARVVLAFEDRTQMVRAYRDAGIQCLQVCDGDY